MVSVANAQPVEVQLLIATPYGISVRDVLTLPCMEGAEVLGGRSGLDREVRSLNVMEVPDVLDWVKPHELLVTTGFPLVADGGANRRADLAGLLPDFQARGLAAVGIKLGRYVGDVGEQARIVADELGLPLLGLPPALSFDDLLQEAYSRLHEVATDALERVDALHNALSLLVLEGADLQQIAAEAARVLGVAVLVTSTDGRVRAAELADDVRQLLGSSGLFDDSGRFRVERASSRPAVLGAGEVRLLPIAAGGADLARLVCVSPQRPLAPADVSAMERVATVAALLLTRQQAVVAVENKYRGDFLRDVFLGRAGDTAFVIEHAASLGWDLGGPMFVVSAELDPATTAEGPVSARVRRMWQERFAAAWRQVCESREPTLPTVDFTSEVVTLVPVPPGYVDVAGAAEAARPAIEQLVNQVRGDSGGGRRPFTVGVSSLAVSLEELSVAYSRARRAAEVGRRVSGGGSTTWFDQLGLHRLIALVPDPAEVESFAADVLGPLAQPTAEAADLRRTLQILLDTNLNVAEAARLQFFHYNTMRYRVTKLERLLGPFTTDPHLRLEVAVALQLLR